MAGTLAKRDPAHVRGASSIPSGVTSLWRRHRPGRLGRWPSWLLVVLVVTVVAGILGVVQLVRSGQQPHPERPDTRFGASPMRNATGPSVVTKFGAGASVRMFSQSIAAPTHPVGASTVHTSFALLRYGVSRDQAMRDVAAGKYDAQIAAAAKGTPAGDSIEIVHEADKKITDGNTTWPVVLAAKNHFYNVAKAANPKVLIVNTVTGWTAEPASGRNFQQWGQIKADIIGIDCDGINPATGAYPNYDAEIAAAVTFVRTHGATGYKHWAVPEFTAGRQATDVDGSKRAAWMTELAHRFRENGALYVDYFDYNNTPKEALEMPKEIAAWRAFVH